MFQVTRLILSNLSAFYQSSILIHRSGQKSNILYQAKKKKKVEKISLDEQFLQKESKSFAIKFSMLFFNMGNPGHFLV